MERLISPQQVPDTFRAAYLPNLKLIDCQLREDSILLRSHARINKHFLHLLVGASNFDDLKKLIDGKINLLINHPDVKNMTMSQNEVAREIQILKSISEAIISLRKSLEMQKIYGFEEFKKAFHQNPEVITRIMGDDKFNLLKQFMGDKNFYDIRYDDNKPKDLKTTVDNINHRFESFCSSTSSLQAFLEQYKAGSFKTFNDVYAHPFEALFWNRSYGWLEEPNTSYKVLYEHGHDSEEILRPGNVLSLDNGYGKEHASYQCSYEEAGVCVRAQDLRVISYNELLSGERLTTAQVQANPTVQDELADAIVRMQASTPSSLSSEAKRGRRATFIAGDPRFLRTPSKERTDTSKEPQEPTGSPPKPGGIKTGE